VPEPISETVRDLLIEQDIHNLRAAGGLQNEVDARLRELSLAIRRLIVEADLGVGTPAQQRKKLDKITKKANALIGEAVRDLNALTRNALGRLAVADVEAVQGAIAQAFKELASV